MIDLSSISDAALACYARASILAACEQITAELDRNPNAPNSATFDIGINLEVGAVMFRSGQTGAVYTLAPDGSVIWQTLDGQHVALRDGIEVVPSGRTESAHLN